MYHLPPSGFWFPKRLPVPPGCPPGRYWLGGCPPCGIPLPIPGLFGCPGGGPPWPCIPGGIPPLYIPGGIPPLCIFGGIPPLYILGFMPPLIGGYPPWPPLPCGPPAILAVLLSSMACTLSACSSSSSPTVLAAILYKDKVLNGFI